MALSLVSAFSLSTVNWPRFTISTFRLPRPFDTLTALCWPKLRGWSILDQAEVGETDFFRGSFREGGSRSILKQLF